MINPKKYRHLDDIDYQIDFLVDFFKLSDNRKNLYLSGFTEAEQSNIKDFEIIFQIHNFDITLRHYNTVNSAFYCLHRINSGTLQKIVYTYFQEQNNLPQCNFCQESEIFDVLHSSLDMYYKQVKLKYYSFHYTNDALLIPMFSFFWGLADLINNNSDFLINEVKRLNEIKQNDLNKTVNKTERLITEIIEKILIGDFISLDDIMVVKSDFIGFQSLVKLLKSMSCATIL